MFALIDEDWAEHVEERYAREAEERSDRSSSHKVGRRGLSCRIPLVVAPEPVKKRSYQGIVHSEIPVNSWVKGAPTIEAARPARCRKCGAAARPVGERLVVVGHGIRLRQLRGAAEGIARTLTLHVRRFRCRACRSVLVVVPRAVKAGRHFERRAIAAALYLFGVAGQAAAAIRAAVGGLGADRRWRTLVRWCDAARDGSLFGQLGCGPQPRRAIAERVAMGLSALVPAGAAVPELERAMAGAERAE